MDNLDQGDGKLPPPEKLGRKTSPSEDEGQKPTICRLREPRSVFPRNQAITTSDDPDANEIAESKREGVSWRPRHCDLGTSEQHLFRLTVQSRTCHPQGSQDKISGQTKTFGLDSRESNVHPVYLHEDFSCLEIRPGEQRATSPLLTRFETALSAGGCRSLTSSG